MGQGGATPAWLADVDWAQPWLAPWRGVAGPVVLALQQGDSLPAALNLAFGTRHAPVRFVPQSELPGDMAYEDYIFRSKQCPTCEGLHDFFNGLCWLQFPQAKQQLNRLQAAEIAAQGAGRLRGPVRDAITVLDENAAFLLAPQPLWDALLAKDWQRLFIELRPLWQEARLLLWGHALLEKLVHPRKPIVAHVYRSLSAMSFGALQSANDGMSALDAAIATDLTRDTLATKPFAPLPVLGVPGWWPDNQQPGFYADPQVFRNSLRDCGPSPQNA